MILRVKSLLFILLAQFQSALETPQSAKMNNFIGLGCQVFGYCPRGYFIILSRDFQSCSRIFQKLCFLTKNSWEVIL